MAKRKKMPFNFEYVEGVRIYTKHEIEVTIKNDRGFEDKLTIPPNPDYSKPYILVLSDVPNSELQFRVQGELVEITSEDLKSLAYEPVQKEIDDQLPRWEA